MGITAGELVRSVFSKSRSFKTHETHMKSNGVEKKRWKTSVRAYLCGDELLFNSVLAEEDSASVKSSEATVTQPIVPREFGEDDHSSSSSEIGDDIRISQDTTVKNEEDSNQNLLSSKDSLDEEHAAATTIQSAFRGFMVRRLRMTECAIIRNSSLKGMGSPSKASLATSIEVQTGNSEASSLSNIAQHKPKPPAFRPKDDWDDSTVDSSIAKMRIQNKLEAMTRRERALAYAFSQQLRICEKKKQAKSEGTEANMGWSWLERWMATRQPEVSIVAEDTTGMKTRAMAKKKFLDLSFEEKESCGSNEVPVQINGSEDKDGRKSSRSRLKASKNISRRQTMPTYHYHKDHAKVSKRDGTRGEAEKERRQKVKQLESKRENVISKGEASVLLSPDHTLSHQNSKSEP